MELSAFIHYNATVKAIIYILLTLTVALPCFVQAIELNSTVMFFNQDDLIKCGARMHKALDLNNTNVNFISSLYVDLDGKKVTQYYLKNAQAEPKKARRSNIELYQKKLISCIRYALTKFKNVYVTILINQIQEDRVWRNFYDYDPLAKYPNYSLYDIAYKPFAKLTPSERKRTYLSLTGEMGRSIKLYPESYSKILKLLPKDLNVGVSINHNQSFGSFLNFSLKLPVLNEFDFIGFSAYAMMPKKCEPKDIKKNIELFRRRIRKYGLTKPVEQWRIHITETGIGGSPRIPGLVTKFLFDGVYGPYDPKKDPWRKPKLVKVRKQFYQCLLTTLKDTNLVQAAFIWNADSLDVQGIYPFSEGYKDQEITQMIEKHNASQKIK